MGILADAEVHADARVAPLDEVDAEAAAARQPDRGELDVVDVMAYVADVRNWRVQYFNRNAPAVTPASLGRVKALFK